MNTSTKDKQQDLLVVRDQERQSSPHAVPAPKAGSLMDALASAAANPAMDVAKVKELYAISKDLMEREAAQAFADAMAHAQANIEPIVKDRRNDHTKSWYATLAAITEEITPIAAAEGLSVSFDTYDPERDKGLPALKEGWVRVIGFCSHRGGHTKKYHLDGPLDDKGSQGNTNKTGIQAMGSTVSYLRRYLVCMIYNVATADDDDGNGGKSENGGKRMSDDDLANALADIDQQVDKASILSTFSKWWNKAEDLKDKAAQRSLLNHRDAAIKKIEQKGRR